MTNFLLEADFRCIVKWWVFEHIDVKELDTIFWEFRSYLGYVYQY